MRIAFSTLGCKLNFAESSAIGKALLSAGHTRAAKGEEADVVILNTCSVTDAADRKGRQAIRSLRRRHPHAMLIVTGCYAQLKGETIAAMPEVDYVFGASEKEKVLQLLLSKDTPLPSPAPTALAPQTKLPFFPACSWDDRTRCFLKVQDGCDYFCTYCTIPFARGRSRNASIADIVAQAQQALAEGAKEIVLTGVNIGDFGKTTNERFEDLLRALDDLDSADYYRIRISSCEPNLLRDEVIDFVAQSRHFMPHFHIPLQSGSDEMLRIMHRHYDCALFAERVAHIRQVLPNAFIGVDCMVGVRGETDERWAEYLAFVESLPVSFLHVFTYSERANTRMLSMDLPVVPMEERERRSKVLHAVSARKLSAFYQAHEGELGTVLWESKREGDSMAGFTENYIRLHRPYDKTKVNTFEQVEI